MAEWKRNYEQVSPDEKNLWERCTFVFDTSSLLNFYEYSTETQQTIFETVFQKLVGRLWVPALVKDEFLKNRVTTLKKPISKYTDLRANLKNLKNQFQTIKTNTKTQNKHPFVDQSIFAEMESSIDQFEKSLNENIDKKIEKINSYEKEDFITTSIESMFRVGDDYSYNTLLEIVAKGELRYRNKIAPGYSDERQKGKLGFQVYGDLIIWFQIIDLSAKLKTSIILITDDRKEDWWLHLGKDRFLPREELIKEMRDKCDQDFWMYSFSEFLEKSHENLNTNLEKSVIEEVKSTGILNQEQTIKLYSETSAICNHTLLPNPVLIYWNYKRNKITLTNANKEFIERFPEDLSTLSDSSNLLVISNDQASNWLYEIRITNRKISLVFISSTAAVIGIRPRQPRVIDYQEVGELDSDFLKSNFSFNVRLPLQ